jgi:acyl carrier protein
MSSVSTGLVLDRSSILDRVVRIVSDMTTDWDLDLSGGIGPETLLIADLAFESIDVVQFVVALEERFGRRNLPFEKLLMVDGRYVDDLSVAQVADFLHDHLRR